MKLFVIIVNGFQLLTIIIKCSILDVAVVLDPPLTWRKCNIEMVEAEQGPREHLR